MSALPDTRELARGRWSGILPEFGVSPRCLSGKHDPCPICGGRDRFRFDDLDGRGTWICSRCGEAGDGFKLAMKASGLSFREVARRVDQVVGSVPIHAPPKARDAEDIRRSKEKLWRSSSPISCDDPSGRWLQHRVGLQEFPPCLRYAPGAFYDGDIGPLPCMLAKVAAADSRSATIHRTFLTPDGRKASVPAPRKLVAGGFPRGGAVRLAPHADVIGVAEGIETALAASKLFDMPVWAAITAGGLEGWIWPDDIRRIVIFGDNDVNFTGQNAAYALAKRARASGVEAEVCIPPEAGDDWNDVLMARDATLVEPAPETESAI
jgi:putative DNA primase/helicase